MPWPDAFSTIGRGALAGSLALLGCAPPPVLTVAEARAGQAALAAWSTHKMPAPTASPRCEVERYYVVHADDVQFTTRCHALPTAAAGCLAWTNSNHFVRWRDWPVLVIGAKYVGDESLVVHELLHALIRCARLGPSVWDAGDYQHANPRIWKAAGGEASVQATADAALKKDAP